MIREASLKEALKLHRQIEEFATSKYDASYFEKRLNGKETLVLVSYINRIPAGYIVAYGKYNDSSFYCWIAAVKKEFRKKGLLKEMMSYLEAWAKNKGYAKIKIKTRNSRREMLNFLVNYGFDVVGFSRHEKDNRILFEKCI